MELLVSSSSDEEEEKEEECTPPVPEKKLKPPAAVAKKKTNKRPRQEKPRPSARCVKVKPSSASAMKAAAAASGVKVFVLPGARTASDKQRQIWAQKPWFTTNARDCDVLASALPVDETWQKLGFEVKADVVDPRWVVEVAIGNSKGPWPTAGFLQIPTRADERPLSQADCKQDDNPKAASSSFASSSSQPAAVAAASKLVEPVRTATISQTAGTESERRQRFLERNPGLKSSVFQHGVGRPISEKQQQTFAVTWSGSTQKRARPNLNEHITKEFELMIEVLQVDRARGDKAVQEARRKAYKNANEKLKKYPSKVENEADAIECLGAGEMAMHVSEIFDHGGKFKQAREKAAQPRTAALLDLTRVWGAGGAAAAHWYDKDGIRSIAELRQRVQEEEEQIGRGDWDAAGRVRVVTAQQLVGLRHLEEFEQRVSREEVEELSAVVEAEAEQLMPGAVAIRSGSYARGKQRCGDCDMLLSHPDGEFGCLFELLRRLEARGFLTDHLSYSSAMETDEHWKTSNWSESGYQQQRRLGYRTRNGGGTGQRSQQSGRNFLWTHEKVELIEDNHYDGFCDTYMGVCTRVGVGSVGSSSSSSSSASSSSGGGGGGGGSSSSSSSSASSSGGGSAAGAPTATATATATAAPAPAHRRIDIKAYPFEQLAFATLAFTSGKHFNQSIRAYAKLKGWSLSDHGLCPVIERESKFKKATVGESLRCATEEEIFWALGLEYKQPCERNCYDDTPGYTAKNQR